MQTLTITLPVQKIIRRLLVPLFASGTSYEALLYAALGHTDRAHTLIAGLNRGGSPHDFTVNLITQMVNFGTVDDDQHGEIEALWAVMLAVRERVGADKQHLIDDLAHESTEGLTMLADEIADYDPDQRVILTVDQFEELFTLTNAEGDRDQFVNLLTTALSDESSPLTVIATLRADFYYLFSHYPDLAALAENNSVIVPPMRISDLYTIIERPAAGGDVRLTFESGLVAEIVTAFRDEYAASTGTLPLLQFTLDQLYQQRAERTLTWDAYEAIGGVNGRRRHGTRRIALSICCGTMSAWLRSTKRSGRWTTPSRA